MHEDFRLERKTHRRKACDMARLCKRKVDLRQRERNQGRQSACRKNAERVEDDV